MRFEVDPLSHVAGRFAHALSMIADLVPFTDTDELPRAVEIACLEDWFTNYRLLIEFLLMKPPANCHSVADLAPGWKAQSTRTARLRQDYGFASENVSHIGKPKVGALTENVHPAMLRVKALFVYEVVDELIDHMETVEHDYAFTVSTAVALGRQKLGVTTKGSAASP